MTGKGNKRPNVVFVVADTARAKNFSTYGYARKTSPNLTRIAEEATLYQNCISTAPWTLPAHASMFTGLFSSHHGCTRSSPSLQSGLPSLPEILQEAGYSTSCITANQLLATDNGINRGFDQTYITTRLFPTDSDYSDIKSTFSEEGVGSETLSELFNLLNSEGIYWDLMNLGDKLLRKKLREQFDKNRLVVRKGSRNNVNKFEKVIQKDKPFFAYINFMETHLQYLPPKKHYSKFLSDDISDDELWEVNQDPRIFNYANAVEMTEEDFEYLRLLYDGAVSYTDKFIGDIYEVLQRQGELEDTLLIIVGDHGENLGEYNRMGHSLSLNDTLLRVPLLVSYPGSPGGIEIDELVQVHDIFRTVLETCGLPTPKFETDSRLLPRSPSDAGREFAIAEYLGSPFEGIRRVMEKYPNVEYEQYDYEIKTIYSDDGMKYTVRSTGEERLNEVDIKGEQEMDQHKKSYAEHLKSELFSRVDEFGEIGSPHSQPDLEDTLKNLGYI